MPMNMVAGSMLCAIGTHPAVLHAMVLSSPGGRVAPSSADTQLLHSAVNPGLESQDGAKLALLMASMSSTVSGSVGALDKCLRLALYRFFCCTYAFVCQIMRTRPSFMRRCDDGPPLMPCVDTTETNIGGATLPTASVSITAPAGEMESENALCVMRHSNTFTP